MSNNKLIKYGIILLILNYLLVSFLLAKPPGNEASSKRSSKATASREKASDKLGKDRVIKTNEEWKKILTPEQYRVMREKRTERPYENAYCSLREPGTYLCVACNNKIFSSASKFDSDSGWPSFSEPVKNSIRIIPDNSIPWEPRLEVLCRRCEGHLGHVFDDGPPPTGLRYCLNSVALKFVKEDEQPKNGKSGQTSPRSNPTVGKKVSRNSNN
jgi:peptide-methionine (R)-S-oxide reductase